MTKRLTLTGMIIGMILNFNVSASTQVTFSSEGEGEEREHAHTLSPEEEANYYREAYQKGNCANRRGISVILKDFMDAYMPICVQEALDEVDGGQLDQLHIIHDGILGDRRHSPRSMHAENRAIDIDSIVVTNYAGEKKRYLYEDVKNRPFYTAFRSCWGRIVHENNGCPYYAGNPLRTGSIGWEDKNHRHHMHTSVPYCVRGKYGSYYYNR